MKTGIELIAEERKRQKEVERWTEENGNRHELHELAFAAVTYAIPFEQVGKIKRLYFWPWAKKCWKPSPDNRIRELAKAGALIAAEIDRIQYQNLNTYGTPMY